MALALAKRLGEVQKAGASKSNLHVQLLQAFAECGHSASASESVQFLQHLRRARDGFRERSAKQPEGPRQLLLKWSRECHMHEGFTLLKQRLFEEGGLEALPDDELSRAYNQLRRLNLKVEDLWPRVQARLAEGKMSGARELLGVWSVAPQEHMAEVDALLVRAMDQKDPKNWQLLSAISRASDWPGSETVSWCSGKLGERLPDLSSEDLALLVAQLTSRLEPGTTAPPALRALAQRAKAELLARDGRLEPLQLCGLVGSMEGSEDELWPMVRKQLLTKTDLSAQQVLQVCRFLNAQRSEDGELGPDDAQLFGTVTKQLQKLLNTRAQPGLVAMVAKHLDCLVYDHRTCQNLLNAAVRLRKDFYPAVLWRLFIRCGEVNLTSRHRDLKSRLENVAQDLEKHGVDTRISLSEMAAVAEAMRQTGVVLKRCAAQMAEKCLEVLMRTQAEVSGAAGHVATEDREGSAPDAGGAGGAEAGASETDWLSEAQRLTLLFWAQLKKLEVQENAALDAAVEAFCAPGGNCRLDAPALGRAVQELEGVEGVSSVRDGLLGHLAARLPSMSPRALVETSALATSPALRRAVAGEVVRRLGHVGALRRGADFDDTVAILARLAAWLQDESAAVAVGSEETSPTQSSLVPSELLHRIAHLVGDSLPNVLEREPEVARRRLSEAVAALEPLEPDGIPLASLRLGLHREVAVGAAWEPAPAAELAFGLAALHSGALPFDAALRLWRFAGGVLEAKGSDGLLGLQAAKLWAFGLAVRQLSSRTARAAMAQTEEAPAMEAFMVQTEKRARDHCFRLGQEAGAFAVLERLRAALPTLLPGRACEERFAVPSTPYVVDVAVPDQRLLLLVPRAAHRAAGSQDLGGAARLMERTLDSMGWRLQWIWPAQWSARLDSLAESEGKEEALAALRGLLGVDPASGGDAASGRPAAA